MRIRKVRTPHDQLHARLWHRPSCIGMLLPQPLTTWQESGHATVIEPEDFVNVTPV